MSHLHDMEELISSIEDNQIKDYMKEAMSCYMANAYRACIVLTYLALFDDIVKKLGELGRVNKKAKKIHDDAQNEINEQDVYENFLIDQLSSNSLLPRLDTNFLDIIRRLRNKSAHPSGHSASAEEARFVFYESINRFLSKPILTTTQLVDNILARLDDQYLFPSENITKISTIVKKETSNLHNETYPYLINKLLDKYMSSSTQIKKNSSLFLIGLSYLKNHESSSSIIKYVIDSKCSDSKFSNLILRLISANGSLISNIEAATYDRLKSIISDKVKSLKLSDDDSKFSHPSTVLSSILQGCDEDLLISQFEEQLIQLFQKNIFSVSFISHMSGHEKVIELYLKEAYKKASSENFDTANNFSKNISGVEKYLSKSLTGEQAFKLIISIYQAAEYGAWQAESLKNSEFSSIPKIRDIAIEYIKSHEVESKAEFEKIDIDGEYFENVVKTKLIGNSPL